MILNSLLMFQAQSNCSFQTANHQPYLPMNQFQNNYLPNCVVSDSPVRVTYYAFPVPKHLSVHPASFPVAYRRNCFGKGHPARPSDIQAGTDYSPRCPKSTGAESDRFHLYWFKTLQTLFSTCICWTGASAFPKNSIIDDTGFTNKWMRLRTKDFCFTFKD